MQSRTFSVDASLLKELGERLIGRPEIALAELVKNSYDADAATCRIVFGDDRIEISDDGKGMSEEDFLEYWMRIGTTHKIDDRQSEHLKRPLTGSKGVGRLAVQFLADEMTLETTSTASPGNYLYAFVDWTAAVSGTDLNTVKVLWEMRKGTPPFPGDHPHGFRIVLKMLKSVWDADALRELGRDVWMLRSPFARSARAPKIRGREDFDVEIEAPGIAGAREAFDEVMKTLFGNWKARIRGTLDRGRSGAKAEISVEFKPNYPDGSAGPARFREAVTLPVRTRPGEVNKPLVDGVKFEILIFRTEGRQPGGISVYGLRQYLAEFGNVSVYDAGFRLPYYGSGRDAAGQDWLSIALDQGRRVITSALLPSHLRIRDRYMLDLPAPGRIFGVVEIDTNHERSVAEASKAIPGQWLQLQSGRDRLHDNAAFFQLRDLVRFSLDFYANRYRVLMVQSAEQRRAKEPPAQKFARAIEALERNKDAMPAAAFREIKREIVDARNASKVEEESLDSRAALLAPLAAAGMAALSLSHELARETRFLDRVGAQLQRIARDYDIPALKSIADEFNEARRRLDSLQELFAPLLSDMDKGATDRLKVKPVVEQTVDAMRTLMPGVKFDLSRIPSDLRFPIGSLAEWNALLQNVLSNAWNAMLDVPEARIEFRGGDNAQGREWLSVSDTGVGLGVPLVEAPKLFEPFERRLTIGEDKRSIAIGGQGLGLAIVRMIARRRSVDVNFVQPLPDFSTTLEISWRG